MNFLKTLRRYPAIKNDPLLAYDAADVLLLERAQIVYLNQKKLLPKVLIMNDAFGAVATGVKEIFPDSDFVSYSDSYLAHQCIPGEKLFDLDQLGDDLKYDEVWMKLPKSMTFFEDQLRAVSKILKPDGWVVVGCMIKHLPKTAFDRLESMMGPIHTELAQKKARLVFAQKKHHAQPRLEPQWQQVSEIKLTVKQGAAVFSRDKLDQGTRFLIEHLPKNQSGVLLDLGCGNGIVGIQAQKENPDLSVFFADESYQAVQSVGWNYQKNCQGTAQFLWTHAASKLSDQSVDWVLCNPPFHQQNTVGTQIAEEMFLDSKRVLRSGGRLRMIGNSHLRYSVILKKIFGNCSEVARNSKFTIQDAVSVFPF